MNSIRTKLLGFIAVISFLGFYSCDKEKLQPVLSFANEEGYVVSDTVLAVGDTIKVMLDITWNGKHRVEKVQLMVNDLLSGEYPVDIDEGQFSITIIKGLDELEVWDFKIIDEGGNSKTISLALTKDPNSKYSAIKYFDNIYLGAQSSGTRPGFMSLSNATYFYLDGAFQNSENIDLLFYYSESEGGTIASPSANIEQGIFADQMAPVLWEVRNSTVFQKVEMIPEVFYMMYHDAYIIENFDSALADDKATNLEVGDTYLFKLSNGKLGVFFVVNINEMPHGDINLAIKIQE